MLRLSLALLLGMGMILITACEAPTPPLTTGVSQELAQWRKGTVSNIRYDLSFDIPAEIESPILAQLTLNCEVTDLSNGLTLDFKADSTHLKSLLVNGESIPIDHRAEHLIIATEHLQQGVNEVQISFLAGELSLNRNDEFLYTLLVPDRARTLFPVFDQPDLKATYSLSLTLPPTWSAVANGSLASVDSTSEKRTFQFSPTQPISTYLFAFTAGEFQKLTDPASGMNMYYRETDDEKVARNAKAIFDLHSSSLQWLEAYTGIDYPFEKFDFALIPAFQYGGMEHPGSIWYRESSLLLEESATINQELRRASLIAHETAHMWFGNLVTMSWFSDVWLKEVFANLMAAKIVNPNFPDINHDLNFFLDHYPAAYAVDRTGGTHPIQQPLQNLEQAGTLYGAIIYEKAPIVMRNLEELIGKEAFQTGIQQYLKEFAYANATWDDLIGILDQQTALNLETWNQDWVKEGGMPIIQTRIRGEGAETTLEIAVSNSTQGQIWPQTLRFLESRGASDSIQTIITAQHTSKSLPQGIPFGTNILPNPDGRTYGYIQLSTSARTSMLRGAVKFPDEVVRASFWLSLWEEMLQGALQPADLLTTAIEAIELEENPLVLSYVLGRTEKLFWQYIPPAKREVVCRGIEVAIIQRFLAAEQVSIKRMLFNALMSLAYTEDGERTLLRIWEGRWDEFDLPLSESDQITLAYEMAVRDMERVDLVLTTTLNRLKNPDRKRSMEFILPALSSDQSVWDAFFESLKKAKNRSHEPWVGTALHYLHHPLRSASSQKHIPASLELIEEIQQTGDIFFPANWLRHTLGAYQSPEAAEMVRSFLDSHPDLSPNLRNKILQAADPLFRASQRK